MTWWNALTVDQESKWYRFCRGWCASNLSPLDKWEPPQFQKMEISTYLNYCITHGCWQPNLMTWWNALTVDQESKWYRFCRGWCASNLSPLDKWEPPQFQKMEISTYLNYCITHGCWQPNLMTWWTVDQESKWYRFCRGWCASNLSPLDKWEPPQFQKMEISTYLNYCITHGCWQPNLIMTWWTVDQESKWYIWIL